MPDLQMMTTMLSHPEGSGQPGDQQTKPTVQALNPGDPLPEHHDLYDDKPGHDQSRHHGREYALFAACEDQHCGDELTPADANRQDESGNGVIAERRVL